MLSQDLSLKIAFQKKCAIAGSLMIEEEKKIYNRLVWISKSGKIYLITTNMEIEFTGIKAKDREQYNSLLDGEHIIHDKFDYLKKKP